MAILACRNEGFRVDEPGRSFFFPFSRAFRPLLRLGKNSPGKDSVSLAPDNGFDFERFLARADEVAIFDLALGPPYFLRRTHNGIGGMFPAKFTIKYHTPQKPE